MTLYDPPPRPGPIIVVAYISEEMLQPTVRIQLNDEDLQTMKAELEELRNFKAAACEKQAKEEEAERLRRKKEADRSRM